uniref:Uncharacterized protein n=1 Tax=Timema genevievae TaxID=629358 RepID=A0A7R9K6K8_TIMGE|nr:unnamed protein product [Timema genevievae]
MLLSPRVHGESLAGGMRRRRCERARPAKLTQKLTETENKVHSASQSSEGKIDRLITVTPIYTNGRQHPEKPQSELWEVKEVDKASMTGSGQG